MADMRNAAISLFESIQAKLPSTEELQALPLGRFLLANANYIICFGIMVVGFYKAKKSRDEYKKWHEYAALPAPDFPTITALEKFEWSEAEPAQLRPFKAQSHMKAADASSFQEMDPQSLLLMDKNYRDRIYRRRAILEENGKRAIGLLERDEATGDAIDEFYTFLIGTYLPRRYPNIFRCHQVDFEGGRETMLQNLTTGEMFSAWGKAQPGRSRLLRSLLVNLGRQLDEDFLFLLPARYEKPGKAKYVLEAYEACCPYGGFDPSENLGKTFVDLRGGAGRSGGKGDPSMDSFLNTLEVGKYFERVVWSVDMNGALFAPEVGKSPAAKPDFGGELNPDQTSVRCERQIIHRLPRSKAIVISYKTYLYPLRQIKEESERAEAEAEAKQTESENEPEVAVSPAQQLLRAIDQMDGGVLPETTFYRDGDGWGERVKEYLRR